MKNNYIKYIYTLVAFTTVMVANAQVVFHETFGTSTTRTTSQYVPQGGNDANLGFSTFTCSSFYKPATEKYTADNKPTCKPDDLGSYNQYVYNISDGYYAVVDPRNKTKSSSPSSLDQLRDWAVTDPAVLGNSGAVLIVNAGELKNQYYRRGVTLKRNTSYKVSFKVLSSSANLPNNNLQFRSKVEVQSLVSEEILATSHIITTTSHNAWELKEYVFKTPNDLNCDNSYAISLRNDNPINSGNDFYIDDIILEEIVDPNAPVILCDTSMSQTGPIIKANDDTFTFQRNKNYNILVNDLYIPNDATLPVVVSGTTPNATIEKVGVWPTGYSIDTSTGQLFISDSATHVPTLAYKITSTQDPTKTSTATIFLKAVDLSVSLAVTNPYVSTSGTSHTYTLKIKNTGAEAIILSSSNKVSILVPQANGATGGFDGMDNTGNTSGTLNGWDWSRVSLQYDYTFTYPDSGTVTLAVGEERTVTFSRDYDISGVASDPSRSITATLNYYLDYFEDNNTSNATIRRTDETITTSQDSSPTPLCYGYSLVLTHNNSSSVTSTSKYIFEYSYDGGLTWFGTPEQDGINTYVLSSVIGNVKVRSVRINAGIKNYSGEKSINVTPNNEITFPTGVNSIAVPLGQSVNLPEITTAYKSAVTYSKVGDTGTVSPTNITLPVGYHEYVVKATTVATGGNTNSNIAPFLGCETAATIKVIVYDPKDCATYNKAIYASVAKKWSASIGDVDNPNNAVPEIFNNSATLNRANYATIVNAVGLLGSTLGVDLYFTKADGTLYSGEELKGKRVVIKLGEQYSGVKVAGGMTVIGRLTKEGKTISDVRSASNVATFINTYAENVGYTYGVKGGVLDALKGDNVFQYSFVPSERDGEEVAYNGVRIQLGSVLAVADLATVFYAYIEEENKLSLDSSQNVIPNTTFCDFVNRDIRVTPPASLIYPTNQRDIDLSWVKGASDTPIANTNIQLNTSVDDAFWGNYSEVLNVASSLSSIVFPYYAVDTDYDSYSLFNATAGVLNRQFLKVKLRQPARIGDQVQITLAYPNINVLNLSLLQLGNFKIVYYLDGAVVGEERLEQFRVLDLGLFRFRDKRRAVLSRPVNFMYDEVELQQFNTVSVNLGDGLHVHDIRINPLRAFAGMTDPKQVTKLCVDEPLQIQKPDVCTGYEISLARVTEYGPTYENADGSPMLDYRGQPIRSIYAIEDIPNSSLKDLGVDNTGFISYFDLNINKLFVGTDYEGKMLIKIQTKRQGCNYGEPQYLRVDITNCVDGAIINPIIKSGANY